MLTNNCSLPFILLQIWNIYHPLQFRYNNLFYKRQLIKPENRSLPHTNLSIYFKFI